MCMGTLGRIRIIAQYSLYEGRRSHVFLLTLALLFSCAALSEFCGLLVLTDSWQTKVSIYAFLARLALVAILTVYVISSLLRDRIDKQTEWLLSIDSPRHVYLYGRTLGFLVTGIFLVVLCGVYPALYSDFNNVVIWILSLGAEISIVVMLSVFVATTFNNNVTGFIAVGAFYTLGRNIGNFLLLSQSPLLQGEERTIDAARYTIEAIHYVMPDFWRYAETGWLIYQEAGLKTLSANIIEALIFCTLLLFAANIDLYRKNL